MTAGASGGGEVATLVAAPLHAATPKPEPAALAAARCGARTRSGAPCRSPAVGGVGRCRMHGGKGSGAPRGNRNAWKHGWHSARIREISRYVRATTPGATRRTIDRLRRAAELQAEKISKSAQQPHATALSANRSQRHTHPAAGGEQGHRSVRAEIGKAPVGPIAVVPDRVRDDEGKTRSPRDTEALLLSVGPAYRRAMHARIDRGGGPDKAEGGSGGPGITRRHLLIGGGAAAGLLVGWAVWPRHYAPNLVAGPGEHVFNAFLKIGTDGRVIVAVPQAEMGQGVYTSLPQILADELGADWRTVGVEPAPISPLYANSLLVEQAVLARLPAWLHTPGQWAAREIAVRMNTTVTAGSSSIRMFEARLREAGAAARSLLCMAAAQRWDVDWDACDTEDGFVVRGSERMRFAELAAAASALDPPEPVALRPQAEWKLAGRSVPRLDLPAKVDGSAQFGADVRLPGLVYASIAHPPYGGGRPAKMTTADAEATPGVMAVLTNPGWVAVVGTNWWAADMGLQRLAVEFEQTGPSPGDGSIQRALTAALDGQEAKRIVERGDPDGLLGGEGVISASYSVPMLAHAPMETLTATARVGEQRIEIWMPTQSAPGARGAVAGAMGVAEDHVVIYPTLVGGGFGRKAEHQAAVEAATIARAIGKPVQLVWPRREDIQHSRFRPPALGRLRARLGQGASIAAWSARIATPSTVAQTIDRVAGRPGKQSYGPEAGAVEGAAPPYAIGALAVEHAEAMISVPTGPWRSVANSYTAFFTESFVDELAAAAGLDPLSFRMQALVDQPRLARCLQIAGSLGGWQGGEPGVGQGLAVHSCFGSHVAMLVEARLEGDQIKIDSVTAVVDAGRIIHPDIVRQQVEGGILWGLGNAFGNAIALSGGVVGATNFDGLGLPTLADTPELRVELVRSALPPGGVGEIAVPPVAPAVANAIFAATGKRLRHLPLRLSDA